MTLNPGFFPDVYHIYQLTVLPLVPHSLHLPVSTAQKNKLKKKKVVISIFNAIARKKTMKIQQFTSTSDPNPFTTYQNQLNFFHLFTETVV